MNRRAFLAAALAAPFIVRAADLLPPPQGRRVVVVGGGWGGLSAARHLRELAPELEVVLLEKNAAFRSLPLSNKWLAGQLDEKFLVHDYVAAAASFGYTFIQAEVTAIERDRRRVVTRQGALSYDWLVLAVGIRHHYEAWFGDDRQAREQARRNFPCGYLAGGDEQRALKDKLDHFAGGNLLMTLPPLPYRCPPAPYERACLIGWLFHARKIKGKLTLLDPNPPGLGFNRIFNEHFRDQIEYVPQVRIKSVDPFNKKVMTDLADFRFDDAILMPPQQAGELLGQADLVARDEQGRPTGWADQHPLHLHAREDESIFLVGDLIGTASPLFGHYPKSGQMASRLGQIAAREIAARAQGKSARPLLPDSTCYVHTRFEPAEMTRVETTYRLRGDGLIVQNLKQHHDPNPRNEDVQWAQRMFRELLGARG